MNSDRVETILKQEAEKNVSLWKKVINNGLAVIAAKYELFVEILQNKYSAAKERFKRQADALKTIIEQLKNPVGS